MKIVQSVTGVPIRLTQERWEHIASRHPEMSTEQERVLATLAAPDLVQRGDHRTCIALRHFSSTPLTEKHCVVVYREIDDGDGFVITAYFTAKPAAWRKLLWKP